MLSLDPIVDNTDSTLEETYKKVVPLSEEIRLSTGYFYLSGFDLVREYLEQLAGPDTLGRAPMRILMGRRTDRQTATEIDEGFSLRNQFKNELREDIESLNRAQIERLETPIGQREIAARSLQRSYLRPFRTNDVSTL